MLAAAQQMEQQSDCRAWLIGTAVFTVNVVGEEQCLDRLALIMPVKKFPKASRHEGNKLCDLLTGNAAEPLAHTKKIVPPGETPRVDLRRRLQKERLQVARQLL